MYFFLQDFSVKLGVNLIVLRKALILMTWYKIMISNHVSQNIEKGLG